MVKEHEGRWTHIKASGRRASHKRELLYKSVMTHINLQHMADVDNWGFNADWLMTVSAIVNI